MLMSFGNQTSTFALDSFSSYSKFTDEDFQLDFDYEDLFNDIERDSNNEETLNDSFTHSSVTNDVQSDKTSEAGDIISDANQPVCIVCGDSASGLHYGVLSCEACKAFFKRTIQGNIKYICLANDDCEITKKARRSCPACRLKKCLKTGMLREGIRMDRHRGAQLKNPRSPYALAKLQQQKLKRRFSSADNSAETLLKTLMSIENEQPQITNPCKRKFSSPETFISSPTSLLTSLLTFDQPPIIQNKSSFLSQLATIFDHELVLLIGWARKFPPFTKLGLTDQMSLLHAVWLELVNLKIAYKSATSHLNEFTLIDDEKNECVVLSDDLVVPLSSSSYLDDTSSYLFHLQSSLPSTFVSAFGTLIRKMRILRITKEEFLFLKAITLFNADIDSLQNKKQVAQQRGILTETLSSFKCLEKLSFQSKEMCLNNLDSSHHHRRVVKLLMLLCDIRLSCLLCKSFWKELKADGNVQMKQLLSEMIDQLSL